MTAVLCCHEQVPAIVDRPETLHRACPLCGMDNRDQPVLSYSREPWRLKQCAGCTFVYLENAVRYEESIANFAWSKTFRQERLRRRQQQPVFSAISSRWKRLRQKFIKRDKGAKLIRSCVGSGRLLDIGCGTGQMLSKLSDAFTPFGIEIDAEAARQCANFAVARGGQAWHNDALSGLNALDAEYFDAILMHAYLEHEIQPCQVLEEVLRVLRPGGLAVIKVPNYACFNRRLRGDHWNGFRFPDHVNHFTPETLSRMVRKIGFRVARFRFNDRTPTSDNMWLVAEKPSTIALQNAA